jgi:hypothetical protein
MTKRNNIVLLKNKNIFKNLELTTFPENLFRSYTFRRKKFQTEKVTKDVRRYHH